MTPMRSAIAFVVSALAALLERVDRLRVVLDRVAELRPARGHQALTSSPVAYMASMPPAMPGHGGGSRTRPAASRSAGRDLDDHLGDRPDADAEQEGRERRREGGGADPGAEHGGRAGEQARARPGDRPRRATPLRPAARRSRDPRWCCGSRSRRRGRRRAPALRWRRPSRSRAPRRGCAGRCRARRAAARRMRRGAGCVGASPRRAETRADDGGEREVGERGAEGDEAAPPSACGASAGDLERLERRVDGEEAEQADRGGEQDADPAWRRRGARRAATACRARPG